MKKQVVKWELWLAVGALVLAGWALMVAWRAEAPAGRESAMERVLRTGVLRCGYYVFPLFLEVDKEGNRRGFTVEMMERIAAKTGLKIEWTEEVNFGNWVPALAANRFDAVCAPMWPDVAKAREVLFVKPMMFSAVWLYSKAGRSDLDGPIAKLNRADITVAAMDGNVTNEVMREMLPLAKVVSVPGNADYGLVVEAVRSGKADVLLWDTNDVRAYEKSNPESLRQVLTTAPAKFMPFSMAVRRGEEGLKHFLDAAMEDLQSTGALDAMIDKWEVQKGDFLRLAKPFEGGM